MSVQSGCKDGAFGWIQISFTFLVHPGRPRQNPEGRKTVVVVVVVIP